MADPATNTSYPAALDLLPEIKPNDRQNEPGIEHDVVHDRANAILNALMQLLGTSDPPPESSVLARLLALESPAFKAAPQRLVSGTTHTLELQDAFAMVCMTSVDENTVVVPLNSVTPFQVNTRIDLSNDGEGQTAVLAGDAAVTINTPETHRIRKRHGKATLIYRGADVWDLEGNLEAAP